MKNVLLLETYEEVLNAHMHAELPELGLYIPAPQNTPANDQDDEQAPEIPENCIFVGINEEGKELYAYNADAPDKMKWNDAVEYCDKLAKETSLPYHLPTQKELMLMYIHKEAVNKALAEAGGEPLKDGWYWSSTEYNNNYSWGLNMGNGIYNYYSKNNYNYVRPVLAL